MRPRQQAVDLCADLVKPSDRVVLTGASGWFGRTALSLMRHSRGDAWLRKNVLAGASATRLVYVPGVGRVSVQALSTSQVSAFRPSIILNCAFPSRSRVAQLGLDRYVSQTEQLSADLLTWVALPSVCCVVTFSSGAAVPSQRYPADLCSNPYGTQKARESDSLITLIAARGVTGTVLRVWAASGPHVQSPHDYALSDFILQAHQSGEVKVRARNPVIRAYCSADDIIALAFSASAAGVRTFDTGGAPVELGELAATIAVMCGGVPVRRPELDPNAAADDYRGDPSVWRALAASAGYECADLTEQIRAARAGLARAPANWASR